MNIKIKNNPKGKSNTPELKAVAEYYFNELCGDKVSAIKNVQISFKRMPRGCGGRAILKGSDLKNLYIEIEKAYSQGEIYRVLAHECTHVKQYALKEITYKRELKRTARGIVAKKVTTWHGKEIRRSSYYSRGWEVEARANEKLAVNVLTKIGIKKAVKRVIAKPSVKVAVIQKPIANQTPIMSKALAILKLRTMTNEEFIGKMMEGVADKQDRLQIRKGVFNLKEIGAIEQYYNEGVTMVRVQLFFNVV